ncbi:MAG: hypothetical protein IT454_17280 [Planctomycetes bacterium]|nr:hypothetical protein [Planctomycetota bacterium]
MSFATRMRLAVKQLLASCVLIALGGLLLGVQVDSSGALVGTGFAPLCIGLVVVLAAVLFSSWREAPVPRDLLTALSATSGFLGLVFVVAGVLAPGGGWMFFELLLLVVVLSRAATRNAFLSRGAIVLLVCMLLFRLWISYQGSRHEWQLMSLEVPILSSLPFEFLAPVQSVSLGEFSPRELGFPPAGLSFTPSLALWTVGFALCIVGLAWRARAALEHENDRVHEAIHELPPTLATLVERVLPEAQWPELGLHGLSERALRKRIEELVVARIASRRELDRALHSRALLGSTNPGGFAGELYRALTDSAPDVPSSTDTP